MNGASEVNWAREVNEASELNLPRALNPLTITVLPLAKAHLRNINAVQVRKCRSHRMDSDSRKLTSVSDAGKGILKLALQNMNDKRKHVISGCEAKNRAILGLGEDGVDLRTSKLAAKRKETIDSASVVFVGNPELGKLSCYWNGLILCR